MYLSIRRHVCCISSLLPLLFWIGPPHLVKAEQTSKVATSQERAPNGTKQGVPGAPVATPSVAAFMSIIPPRLVDDMFGHRLSRRYLAIQVTIVNENKDRDLIINDISIDYSKIYPNSCRQSPVQSEPNQQLSQQAQADIEALYNSVPQVKNTSQISALLAMTQNADLFQGSSTRRMNCEASSNDLSVLRGVAERGQAQDPRNYSYRIMQAIGIVGGGLTGVAGLGDVLPKAVAAYNGPGLAAFVTLFPDFTVNQMNRLSDSAYSANTVVPKGRSKVVVAFIPLALLLSSRDMKPFRNDPYEYFRALEERSPSPNTNPKPPKKIVEGPGLKDLQILVEYNFIVSTTDIPPSPSVVQLLSDNEANGFLTKSDVHRYIEGQFLYGSDVSLTNGNTLGLKAELDASRQSSDSRLYFVLKVSKPVAPATVISFQLTKKSNTAVISTAFSYSVQVPTLTSISPTSGDAGTDLHLTLGGSHLYDLGARLIIRKGNEEDSSIVVSDLSLSGNTGTATLSLKPATPGTRSISIQVNGQTSGTQTFMVTPSKK